MKLLELVDKYLENPYDIHLSVHKGYHHPSSSSCKIKNEYGEETIVGLKKTPEFGHAIMFGKGGSKVEEEKDVAFRILPASSKEIDEMIKDTQFHKILEERQVNMKILKRVIKQVVNLAKKYPKIIELDLNPLFVTSKEAKIADARIITEE